MPMPHPAVTVPAELVFRPTTANHHWSRLTISLLWVYRGPVAKHVSGYMIGTHHMAAWLVTKGDVTVTAEGKTVSATAGDWMIPKPTSRHQHFSGDAEILSINFRMEWPEGGQLFHEGLSVVLKSLDHPELERLARKLERTVEQVTHTRYHDTRLREADLEFPQFITLEKQALIWSEAIYHALIQAGLRPNLHQTNDPRIHGILQHLDEWPLDESFRTEKLARLSGLSRSNLDRVVVKSLGISCKAHVDRRRLNHAIQRLADHAVPIKQIAIETGFRHSSSFCAWFRRKTGRYPGEIAGRIL